MRFTLDGESFELTSDLVRARLVGHVPEDVHQYWVEIDGTRWPIKQVISVATGVSDRRRFQSPSARRWLQGLGFTIGGGGPRAAGATRRLAPEVKSPASSAIALSEEGLGGPDGAAVTSQLNIEEMGRSLSDIIESGGADLRVPGMYSWWVDEVGAGDLTVGLGHPIQPGLLYAGLAGATRRGGEASSNTLWGRIVTMHLGTRYQFSTLRRSLGSILAELHAQPTIDEEQLTRWMHMHLWVVPVPVADVEMLDHLESQVLTEVDPPLNLSKVPKTPLRVRLSSLRRKYSGSAAKVGGSQ